MDEPRWLVDEMLGRLCRYLRFLGYDAEYVRSVDDDAIVRQVHASSRRLITRDRRLAGRVPGAILLSRTDLAGQFAELRGALPTLARTVRFVRCSLCNGLLAPVRATDLAVAQLSAAPPEVRQGTAILYRCTTCAHLYWEGTHTRSIQQRLDGWFASAV